MVDRPPALPIVDVEPLVEDGSASARTRAGAEIVRHCREVGFFCAVGHRVDPALLARLEAEARRFFARPETEKARIAMQRGGRGWRGWFPVGGELTSGVPDRKEGVYFGAELGPDHPLVRAGTPLHGPNLFPADMPAFREAVLAAMAALEGVGQALMRGVALGLGLPGDTFRRQYTAEPLVLFRIFHYPPADAGDDAQRAAWGVGEHTDYGFLTLLAQDDTGGLEVRTPDGWIATEPVAGALVCNVGDMLERLTMGRLRSTPHRVCNRSNTGRLSFPFFFDPGWNARVLPIEGLAGTPAGADSERWDGASVHDFSGTYGDYVLAKIARVFPDLGREVLDRAR